MTNRAAKEDDQLARFGRELTDRDWLTNARRRSQRRQSSWNLLLPLFGLPLWVGFAALLVALASVMHTIVYPSQPHRFFGLGPADISDALVLLPSFVGAVAPAMFATNFLVYLIPSARRAMGAEDRNYSGVDYKSSQRALLKVTLWVLVVCIPIIVVGAALN